MDKNGFIAKSKKALQALQSLQAPIRTFQKSAWKKKLSWRKSADGLLTDLGVGRLTGAAEVSAHITKAAVPPLDLEFSGDPAEKSVAFATILIQGGAVAGFNASEAIQGGEISAGATGGVQIRLAHHRQVSQAQKGVNAVVGLVGDLTFPSDLDRVRSLADTDILQFEFDGNAILRAHGAWQYGMTRELSGKAFDSLQVEAPVTVDAGVTLGVTFLADLRGVLRVVVSRPTETEPSSNLVRVRLHKAKSSFVSAGLDLRAELDIGNPEEFVTASLQKMLRLPDGAVAQIEGVKKELSDLRSDLGKLSAGAKSALAKAAGKAVRAMELSDLQAISQAVGGLSPAHGQEVGALIDKAESLLGSVTGIQERLEQGIADLADIGQLDAIDDAIDGWLDAYSKIRRQVSESVTSRVKEGLTAEFSAEINRTQQQDALLDLVFDLNRTQDAYLAAVRGNFAPALEKAAAKNGNTGVEIIGGTLKKLARAERSFGLELNLFGFKVTREMTSWKQTKVESDLVAGTTWLVGESGAKLFSTYKGQVRNAMAVFEIAGAVVDSSHATPVDRLEGRKATITRSASLKHKAIGRMMPLHLGGAEALGRLTEVDRDALEKALLNQPGDYSYDLRIGFSQHALRKAFLADERLTKDELRTRLWSTFKLALRYLDMDVGQSNTSLSNLVTWDAIEQVERGRPDGFKTFWASAPPGVRLEAGAHRFVWVYLREGYLFIQAFKSARKALLDGSSVKDVSKELRDMARTIRATAGALSTKPVDAKFLMLALLADPLMVDTSIRFHRGEVDVTV